VKNRRTMARFAHLRRSVCAAALLGAILILPTAGWAGPADEVAARTHEIQAMLDAGKPVEGEAAARAALDQAQTALGPDSPVTADLNRLLGDALYSQGKYDQAEPCFRTALSLRTKIFGRDHLDTAQSTSDLALTLRNLKRYDEAEPLFRQAIATREKLLGPEHGDVARSWFRLSRMLDAKGEYAKAAEALGKAVEIGTKAFGPDDRTVVLWTGERAAELHDAGDHAAAEPVYRQAIERADKTFPADDLELATFRSGLATLLRQAGNLAEAELLYRLALAAREKGLGGGDPRIATTAEGLGRTLDSLGRAGEAVPLYERALHIREQADGPESTAIANILSRLGDALLSLDRAEDAEPVFRRLLAYRERTEQPEDRGVHDAVRSTAMALDRQSRSAEAETFRKRALAIAERIYGPDDFFTAYDLLSLGLLYAGQQRFKEGEPLLTRAIAVMEGIRDAHDSLPAARSALAFLKFSLGEREEAAALLEDALASIAAEPAADERAVADLMLALAQMRSALGETDKAERLIAQARSIYARHAPQSRAMLRTVSLLGDIRLAQGRAEEAFVLYNSVLAELEQRYGAESPETQSALAGLGRAAFAADKFDLAAGFMERSVALIDRIAAIDATAAFANRTGAVEDEAIARAASYDHLIKTYDRLAETAPASRAAFSERAFRVAQRVIESEAAQALAQLAARQAAGSGRLAALVRERQDLVDAWRASDLRLTELRAAADRNRAGEQAVAGELAALDQRITAIDATLAREFPSFADLQKPATVDFADVQARLGDNEVLLFYADTTKLGETGFETYLWAVPKIGERRWVRLSRSTGELGGAVQALRNLMGVGPQSRGAQSLSAQHSDDRTGKVLDAAKALHDALLAPVADMIGGKDLVIVPSKRLAGLPFQLLVSEAADASAADRYRQAAWLAHDHAITVLPSVGALDALAARTSADERQPYLGFANPLLTGRSGEDQRAFDKGGCAGPAADVRSIAAADGVLVADLFRGGSADVAAVRHLEPLPETVDEACAVAAALGADATSLRLGAAATEAEVKNLSEAGELAKARILHFATHGLVSGELDGFAEPAIVLTPPDAASERDDGLLTASEVTTLRLDADWVILSACNTAAGDGGGEALSGLARAFFYAGAQTLMVSHWPVNSAAAVELATGAVEAVAADPTISRAEALRRAMLAEIDKGGTHADPANWAPFVVVGVGR
jgi:CHAT domain-containing protein